MFPVVSKFPVIDVNPKTFNSVKLPTDVILGCDDVAKVPVIKPLAVKLPVVIFPVTISPLSNVTWPLTVNSVNVPTNVIFGCDEVAK